MGACTRCGGGRTILIPGQTAGITCPDCSGSGIERAPWPPQSTAGYALAQQIVAALLIDPSFKRLVREAVEESVIKAFKEAKKISD